MGRSLVIVESPGKIKTISKYLGKDFVVKSSFGHVRDLPTSGGELAGTSDAATKAKAKTKTKGGKATAKATATQRLAAKLVSAQAALVRRMGVDPEHDWAARYQVLPDKEKVIAELQGFAEKADVIYLATDRDREGEAIAWHLRECIGGDPTRFRRVTFSEITQSAIQDAFKASGDLDMAGVHAQQARRFLDRVVGFMVSPLLWAKVARNLSAGRVQSVAMRLVVEREHEIRSFIPDEYWEVFADLADPALRAQVTRCKGAAFKPVTQQHADTAVAALGAATFRIAQRDDKPARSFPSAPFITSTLQQASSLRLGFSVKKTMTLAQKLYEAGHITYMRTDSANLSVEAVTNCRSMLLSEFGPRYLPEQPIVYKSKATAQEAHEAIRPTDVTRRDIDGLESDQAKLYALIWAQFVACQMTPAEFDTSVITISAGDYELVTRGRVLRFDGYQRIQLPLRQDDVALPQVEVGQVLRLVTIDPSQHFTKPPPRYSEASLVKELEKRSIGRPSTYASIISTIQDRGYVKLADRRFYAEKLGDIVTDRLLSSFPDLMDYNFTAGMEKDLDDIAEEKAEWKHVLDTFYHGFKSKLQSAKDTMRANEPVVTTIPCDKCGRMMAVRTGQTGVFLGCTGYNLDKKERCTNTRNLVSGDEAVAVTSPGDEDESSDADARAVRAKKRCPICQTAMDGYLLDEHHKLHICGRNPDCAGTLVEEGQFKLRGYEGPSIECDKCAAPMQLKTGRFGKYFGCTRYPECRNTRKLLRSGQAAPPKAPPIPMPELACEKGGHFVLRDGALGIFLASNLYPRVRETRAPLVDDLIRHRDELDPKFQYLAAAPRSDPDGNPVQVRFSRKTREHYLTSVVDGEPTGWSLYLQNGVWAPPAADAVASETRRTVKK